MELMEFREFDDICVNCGNGAYSPKFSDALYAMGNDVIGLKVEKLITGMGWVKYSNPIEEKLQDYLSRQLEHFNVGNMSFDKSPIKNLYEFFQEKEINRRIFRGFSETEMDLKMENESYTPSRNSRLELLRDRFEHKKMERVIGLLEENFRDFL